MFERAAAPQRRQGGARCATLGWLCSFPNRIRYETEKGVLKHGEYLRAENEDLFKLLDNAKSDDGATVVIPDLQRPYVWTPNQVTLLIDSLIRGWPFGTLLMWKAGPADLERIPHRQFWQVVDKTDDESGTSVARKDPPAFFQMVLDGQQRVQSLLLARVSCVIPIGL